MFLFQWSPMYFGCVSHSQHSPPCFCHLDHSFLDIPLLQCLESCYLLLWPTVPCPGTVTAPLYHSSASVTLTVSALPLASWASESLLSWTHFLRGLTSWWPDMPISLLKLCHKSFPYSVSSAAISQLKVDICQFCDRLGRIWISGLISVRVSASSCTQKTSLSLFAGNGKVLKIKK